jgi:hypothetical protein
MKRTSFGILLLAFGATIGESHVSAAKEISGDTDCDYQFDEQHSAWKLLIHA